jgi:hypothetical protein
MTIDRYGRLGCPQLVGDDRGLHSKPSADTSLPCVGVQISSLTDFDRRIAQLRAENRDHNTLTVHKRRRSGVICSITNHPVGLSLARQ